MFPRFDLLAPNQVKQELLICYPPGARGDFLAQIIRDNIHNCYDQYIIRDQKLEGYKKVHWAKELIGVPTKAYSSSDGGYTGYSPSIRIQLNNLDDFLTVAYFWRTKLSQDLSEMDIVYQLVENERLSRNINHMFDYIVDFKSLFDIESIKDLYQTIRNQELSDLAIKYIQHNISLQQWVTTSTTDLNSV